LTRSSSARSSALSSITAARLDECEDVHERACGAANKNKARLLAIWRAGCSARDHPRAAAVRPVSAGRCSADLLRLSFGIEHADDLLANLVQVLDRPD
jgi:O-acetylhomoserine/O-acetylserine sulfhydrylase-like pyridoxal-dependent enzyme